MIASVENQVVEDVLIFSTLSLFYDRTLVLSTLPGAKPQADKR
jgi:hypothetical protein